MPQPIVPPLLMRTPRCPGTSGSPCAIVSATESPSARTRNGPRRRGALGRGDDADTDGRAAEDIDGDVDGDRVAADSPADGDDEQAARVAHAVMNRSTTPAIPGRRRVRPPRARRPAWRRRAPWDWARCARAQP